MLHAAKAKYSGRCLCNIPRSKVIQMLFVGCCVISKVNIALLVCLHMGTGTVLLL